ncbi:unnamed protein product [Oikopleura dioica]|uniref:Uncharacterized protein n=1 Tax=Oikopleura dioica TaxID=34765 RepID=E4Y5Z4_OIKDI|nr:unnamed protein product [Oikopleura dioica]
MKLFIATVALAKAQDIDAGDESRTFSFGDSAYSFGDDAYSFDAEARDKDEARYFGGASVTVTTPTVPPTTTTTHESDTYCIKCDVMDVTSCVASATNTEKCAHGDVCFLEVRRNNPRTGAILTQLCTGCKSPQACFDLKDQNMVASATTPRGLLQCFPTMHLLNVGHRLGEMASVCRTCFIPSDSDYANDATKDTKKFLTGTSATTITIPLKGDGLTGPTPVNLEHEDVTEHAEIWFSDLHGLTLDVHGLNFGLTYN